MVLPLCRDRDVDRKRYFTAQQKRVEPSLQKL